jgi:hypothetical protein
MLELSNASWFYRRPEIESVQFQARPEECLKKASVVRLEANEAAIMNVPTPRTKCDFFIVLLVGPRSGC